MIFTPAFIKAGQKFKSKILFSQYETEFYINIKI